MKQKSVWIYEEHPTLFSGALLNLYRSGAWLFIERYFYLFTVSLWFFFFFILESVII